MAEQEPVSRKAIESKARAYLERSRSLHAAPGHGAYLVVGPEFEAVVQRLVAQTIRQIRGIGKRIVD